MTLSAPCHLPSPTSARGRPASHMPVEVKVKRRLEKAVGSQGPGWGFTVSLRSQEKTARPELDPEQIRTDDHRPPLAMPI